ncbi:MAG: hypothetical protein WAO00_08970 [Chthoniobacterales bacterium]
MNDREPLTERATLYRVNVKVRALPGHPLYWDCQCGILCIWLFANSPGDAAERVAAIVAVLPYERVGDEVSVCTGEENAAEENRARDGGPSEETRKQCRLREQLARESGMSMLLIAVAVGGDDTGFEQARL